METGHPKPDDQDGAKPVESPLRTEMSPQDVQDRAGFESGAPATTLSAELPPIGVQIGEILNMLAEKPEEGEAGYVISLAWLGKAMEMSEKDDSANEPLGPIDNTALSMVVDPSTAPLLDEKNKVFIPLRPGLQIKEDYEIFPPKAWEKIVSWHGLAKGSPVIVRYCHNTSSNENFDNMQYEIYPPIFTLFKLPHMPPIAGDTSNPSPARILASRHEMFARFLTRAKMDAKIHMDRSVRVWRFLGGSAEAASAQSGVLTPANSRSTSPVPSLITPVDLGRNMSINVNTFLSFQEGSQREAIDMPDETQKKFVLDKSNLGEVGLGQEGVLVLEEQINGAAGGDWVSAVAAARAKGALIKSSVGADGMLKPGSTASGRTSPTPSMTTRGRALKGRSKGTVGLGNLGNTCYMNSALQCVRACEELTEYFLGDFYKKELNPSNPLGNNGEVAKAYANLLKEIYKGGNASSFSPRQFRQTIGKHNPQFSGYQQQDSQEFVLFLLDGLQEDLNRITKKPYIEKPDSTDEMVYNHEALKKFADKNWEIYKARNDSVITDLFAGMYKSTLKCPVCNKVSIIFDPYNNLTLQLPIENTWAKKVLFFPLHSRPIEVMVEVDKGGSMEDVRNFVARKIEVPEDHLVLAEIYSNAFYKIFEDNEGVGDVRDGDVVAAFQVDGKPTNWPDPREKPKKSIYSFSVRNWNDDDSEFEEDSPLGEQILVPVVNRGQSGRMNRKSLFGNPGFITLTRDEAKSYGSILRKMLNYATTMTTLNFLDDESENEGEDSDTVLMNVEDAESGSSTVNSSSVQGEEGVVDISMRDADDSTTGRQIATGPRIAYPPMAPIHRDPHSVLRQGRPLPDRFDQIFEMRVYKGGGGTVPSGVHVPEDTKTYPTIKKRAKEIKYGTEKERRQKAKAEAARKKADLKSRIRNGGSPSDSEDELAVSHDLPPATADASSPASADGTPKTSPQASGDASSDDDGIPPVQEATDSLPRGYDDADVPTTATLKKQQERFVSDEILPKALVNIGEGIVLDWPENVFDAFFGEGPGDDDDTFRGAPTWGSMQTLPDSELDAKRIRRTQRKKEGVSLDDCLDEFGKPEILSENDAWYCPKCKEHRRASKTFELWKVPDVLVIHLKRFSVQGRFRDKLDWLVNFPTQGLDLTERMKGKEEDGRELLYDLFAVDNHYGGLGGGHYTAYARNFVDDNWYYFDDSMASRRNADDSITAAAYLLFYRRRNSGAHLGGSNFDKVYRALETDQGESDDGTAQSRGTSPGGTAPSGEGRRLDSSSRDGSSSAFPVVAAVHQAGGGGRQGAVAVQPQAGSRARTVVNGTATLEVDDEGYGGELDDDDEDLPTYAASQSLALGQGPLYGNSAPWNQPSFSWDSQSQTQRLTGKALGQLSGAGDEGHDMHGEDDDNEADVSSTGAVGFDEDRSPPSTRLAGTPEERMDEDDDGEIATELVSGHHHHRVPTPEVRVAEIHVPWPQNEGDADPEEMAMD